MIEIEMNYGEEECAVLTELVIDSAANVKRRKIWKVILIVAGIYELVVSLWQLFTTPSWMTVLFLVIAAAAFFLAFGGERYLTYRAVLRKTKKLNALEAEGARKYTFDEKGATVSSASGSGSYSWKDFAEFGELRHYLWARRNDQRYVLVDLNRLSDADRALLRKYCAEKISTQRA